MKHRCGCETTKLPDGGILIKPCEQHTNSGYVWIALQHEEKQKRSELELTVIPLEETVTEHQK